MALSRRCLPAFAMSYLLTIIRQIRAISNVDGMGACSWQRSESVREVPYDSRCLAILRSIRRIMARRRKARGIRGKFSKSLARRRRRPSQPKVRSHDPAFWQHFEALGGAGTLDLPSPQFAHRRSRMFTVCHRPPRFTGGISRSTSIHSSSVRSLG